VNTNSGGFFDFFFYFSAEANQLFRFFAQTIEMLKAKEYF
jgi:hypothetical protein